MNFLVILLLLAFAAFAQPVDASVRWGFDGTLSGDGGQMPLSSNQVGFVPGISNQAVRIGTNGWLTYSATNLNPAEGTIEFWIRPDWNGNQHEDHTFFKAGENFNRGMVMMIDGANNLRFILWGDDPSTPSVETGVERGIGSSGAGWRAGEWYHWAATWKGATRELALYINGRSIAQATNGVVISAYSRTSFTLSLPNAGGSATMAAIDEFRAYPRKLTDAEVWRDYCADRGVLAFLAPRGLASDGDGNTYMAETDGDAVRVFSRRGDPLRVIGESGSGPGQFHGPSDVAIDGEGRLWVTDSRNHRVQTFTAAGEFSGSHGGPGMDVGLFNAPAGCGVDPLSGRVYVADTGNHRVQRLLPDGSVDVSWGEGGAAGRTGFVQRDHAGFDRPMDVAVSPVSGAVYIADYGNCRLEVYDTTGRYARTYYAVYHPTALAFAANGDLYIAGEDPNEAYPPYDGRVRYLRAGDELVSHHYTGGLDDLGRALGGVSVVPDGSIVVSDTLNGRLVRFADDFAAPLSDLRMAGHGSEVRIRWHTREAVRGAVRIGTNSTVATVVEGELGLDHDVTVEMRPPAARHFVSVAFADSFNRERRWTAPTPIHGGAAAGTHAFLRIKAAGLLYTDTHAGAGYVPMSSNVLAQARSRFNRLAQFYWRNSGFRLWLDIQVIPIDRDITESPYNVWNSAQGDLAELGFGASDDWDAVWAASPLAGGNFGGSGSLFGRSVAMGEWVTQDDFVAIHEVNHTIDSIYALCGISGYAFNHGIWAVPGGLGRDFAVNAQILRNVQPLSFATTIAPFDKIMLAPDADEDGVPDRSPDGLLTPLPITEQTLGTSARAADSDGDGVGDLEESMALPAHGSDALSSDTDLDGVRDGNDLNPIYRMGDHIAKGSPVIDGVISPSEGWTVMTAGWGFENDTLVADANHLQAKVTTYAAWDDRCFYLGLVGPSCGATIHLDGSADNWFMGPDNYKIHLHNDVNSKSVQINVGVPDLFRQIDDDGQFSEFFDTHAQWQLPYQGRHFYDHSSEGAGYPGRLVTEADLNYMHGGGGTNRVWEVAIPWSGKSSFRGGVGKILAIGMDLDGDILFETDRAACLKLVENVSPRNPSVAFGPDATMVSWDAVPGVRYGVWVAEAVIGPWRYAGTLVGQGRQTSFVDDGSATGTPPSAVSVRFYQLRVPR